MSAQSLSMTGLILDLIGAVFFIVDTNKLSLMLTGMVKQIAEDHGKHDSRQFSKQEIEDLQSRINSSRRLTLLGYLFLGTGFFLQLISYIIK